MVYDYSSQPSNERPQRYINTHKNCFNLFVESLNSVHLYLHYFSCRYCNWVDIPFDNHITQLPCGLGLKSSDGTRPEEVATTMVARSAGFLVPKVVPYREHPDTPYASVSIL
ncbi:hypothetical protein P153DRAFT_230394 [Dothidotthia symphoricarpi CBS 119687]|uniref:Uncharacterized protein n=1 Tax=Dothidotthia symphoricarpi CBS 119687 TaxID=1392245 RepID=A0A6A6AI07_9PLEO|nr:uncharacterized protein P153DRAFT_230394 [Dothidotthia symphoricarpi CBS 119687]KAF2130071.1 hypothetical protein P153DRAFT_230394 [Dothidotthia symphoricarpi CBS 119687]